MLMLAPAIIQKRLLVSGAFDPETFTLLRCKASAKVLKKGIKLITKVKIALWQQMVWSVD